MPQKPQRLKEILAANGVESQLELLLLNRLQHAGLPLGEAQVRIVPGRKYTYDRVWQSARLAVEVQGGVHSRMGHSTGVGIERDCEKFSLAAANGYRVIPVTEKQIEDGRAVEWIARALGVTT